MNKLMKIEEEFDALLFADSKNFKRDCQKLLDIYLDIYNTTHDIPKFSDVFEKADNYNIEIASEISKKQLFDYTHDENYRDALCECINNILLKKVQFIDEKVYNALESLDVVFENDYYKHPLYLKIQMCTDKYRVLTNSSMKPLSLDMHSKAYNYDIWDLDYSGLENISNSYIEARRPSR